MGDDDLEFEAIRPRTWLPRGPVIAIGSALLIVGVGIAYALGTPDTPAPVPVPATVTPIVQPATRKATRAAPTQSGEQLVGETIPEPPSPIARFVDRASVLQSLGGEPLIGALWEIDQSAERGITYAMLARNAERFSGRTVVFSGRVLEIHDEDGGSFLRLSLGDEDDHVIAVLLPVPAPEDIVAESHVRAYGVLGGTFSYHSQAGWDISIPQLIGLAVVHSSVPRRAPRQ